VPEVAPLDPERLVRVLADADITPDQSRDNLERLSAALRELAAKVYTESVPEGLSFDAARARWLARRCGIS